MTALSPDINSRRQVYNREYHYSPRILKPSAREVDYIDIAPKPFIVQIPLVEYFERIKRLKADRWQIHLCNWLQNAVETRHVKGSFGAFHAEPQLGKPLDVETLVQMSDGGYKRLGDIVAGDYIITHKGRPRKVLKVFTQGYLETLEIVTGGSRSVVAALDHPFLTPEGWVQAKDLQVGQSLGCVSEPNTTGVSTRDVEEFELLGYFLGDGCVAGNNGSFACNITTGDPFIKQRLLDFVEKYGWKYRIFRKPGAKCDSIHFSGGTRNWVRNAGIAKTDSWTKRVPAWVFTGSREQVAAFLGAYFACDGTFGRQRNTVIDFGSVSVGLLQDVQRLLLRVGVQSRIALKNGVYKGLRHQSHRLYFCSQDFVAQFIKIVPIIGLKGQDLQTRRRPRLTFAPKILADNIISIKSAGKRECRCLSVEEDKTFTANDLIVHNTTILSQIFKAWCYGHDPFWRAVLAMYNVTRSETHSEIVIQVMRSNTHKEIFTDKDGHLPNMVSKTAWNTNARMDIDQGRSDGQRSFSAVGLQSGITGSSADWYTIDDPYKDPKEAFSIQVRANLDRFWKFGIEPRLTPHSCIAAMFHRYAYDDFGGYLLDTGLFEYLRYATVADGDYIHEETGQRFPDPLGREPGEYISPTRRPPSYYTEKRKDARVWNSMFQGKPSSDEGDFFKVGLLKKITNYELAAIEREQCITMVRAWDNAATTAAGDFTAGALMGIKPNGEVVIFDMKLAQLDTAERIKLQEQTAAEDGADVTICIPRELASAGKDNVFFTEHWLQGYTVVARSVISGGDAAASTPKARRAYNFSVAVNSGEVSYVIDDRLPEDKKWNKLMLQCLRQFLLSSFDDPVDALGDGYNYLHEIFRKGLVVKNYKPQRNLVTYSSFVSKFPFEKDGRKFLKIPEKWTIYIGVKIQPEASKPTSAVMVARASANSYLKEHLFVFAEYKAYDGDHSKVFAWIKTVLASYCENQDTNDITVWLHPHSKQYLPTIRQKVDVSAIVFDSDEFAGITELNWYLLPKDVPHHFNPAERDANMYLIVPNNQFSQATDQRGLYASRQEISTWGFNEKGEPSKIGAVLECLRMITYKFHTSSVPLTVYEEIYQHVPEDLHSKGPDEIVTPEMQMARQGAYEYAVEVVAKRRGLIEEEEEEGF